ncbi:MAG: hypothetical protein R3B54_05085 [Bdellovibrionota bacterium]
MSESSLRFYSLVLALFFVAASSTVQVFALVSVLTYILNAKLALYTLYFGAFLFGMGGGSYLSTQVKRTTKREISATRNNLTTFQMWLSGAAAILIPATCMLIAATEYLRRTHFLLPPGLSSVLLWCWGILPIAYLGYLTGRQLPMVAAILKKRAAEDQVVRFLFGYDYAGALAGALLFLLVLFPQFGVFRSLYVSAFVSALASLFVQGLLSFWNRQVFMRSALFLLLSVVGMYYGTTLEILMDNLVFGF